MITFHVSIQHVRLAGPKNSAKTTDVKRVFLTCVRFNCCSITESSSNHQDVLKDLVFLIFHMIKPNSLTEALFKKKKTPHGEKKDDSEGRWFGWGHKNALHRDFPTAFGIAVRLAPAQHGFE